MAQVPALKIDSANTAGVLTEKDVDLTFEQLDYVGLEGVPGSERLVATLRVKQNEGYSGDICSAGSFEYVAFWADWDNKCAFTYLGTVPVRVHDINRPAGKDLCYTAVLPVDLSRQREGCEVPKIARVRAVLSWDVPPSTTDSNALHFWGNFIDTHVRIQPGGVSHPLNGHFVARDANFGLNSLGTLPVAGPTSPGSGTTQTAAPPGDPWSLNTTRMQPCGYDIHLAVADRSIVNRSWGKRNVSSADTGLYLLANS